MTPETALIDRLRRGESGALGEAYAAYHAHVRGFARRLVGEAAADDLAQETFLSLPSAIERFRGDAPLRAFLVSIAANHARHHARTAKRRRAAVERFAGEAPPSVRTPERDAARAELANALARALDAIPAEQREAIVLCDVEERTAAEAAARIGVPENTVRTRAFHGKRKLRVALVAGLALCVASAAYACMRAAQPRASNTSELEVEPVESIRALPPLPSMHVPIDVAAPSPDAHPVARPDPEPRAYASAHEKHFVQHDHAAALEAWDAYLAAFPHGRFVLEARYNRAICLVRIGRLEEAKRALAPFASGSLNGYRQAEAARLLEALE
jgi:RNA polymerase sigma-70 factor (ECF subfamily)